MWNNLTFVKIVVIIMIHINNVKVYSFTSMLQTIMSNDICHIIIVKHGALPSSLVNDISEVIPNSGITIHNTQNFKRISTSDSEFDDVSAKLKYCIHFVVILNGQNSFRTLYDVQNYESFNFAASMTIIAEKNVTKIDTSVLDRTHLKNIHVFVNGNWQR